MTETNSKNTTLGVWVHSFFVIPFIIAVLSVLLISGVKILIADTKDVYDYLNDIHIGGRSKRWQAAFELSKLFQDPRKIPQEKEFSKRMIELFEHSVYDDKRVKTYLALAMGRSQNRTYIPCLIKALANQKRERNDTVPFVFALGLLKAKESLPSLKKIYKNGSPEERLAIVVAWGQIGGKEAVDNLIVALDDKEPNVTWEAAVNLAKVKNSHAKRLLSLMLTRSYWKKFKNVDEDEKNHAIIVSIRSAGLFADEALHKKILELAESDRSIRVRRIARTVISSQV